MNYQEAMKIVNMVKNYPRESRDCWWQFRSCNAYFGDICNLYDMKTEEFIGNYRLFRSYSTIVALVDIENGVVYELGKWSRTTSKQVTQFCNQYYGNFKRVLLKEEN